MSENERAAAIRRELIDHVAANPARPRRAWLVVGSVVAGVALGAGGSTAAFAAVGGFPTTPRMPSGQPSPSFPPAVDAPAGTQPGAPIVVLLGDPMIQAIDAAATVSIADRPGAATHLRVMITALTTGDLNWGTDAGGNNPTASFDGSEVGSGTPATWFDFPLDASVDALYLTPSDGFTGVATLQYLTDVPTHLGRNAEGETYGVPGGPDGAPDLIAVEGKAPDGSFVDGYARNIDLNASSPDHPGMPTSPDQALEWQAEIQQRYPNGWDIPVYESDGTTQIGTFHIGM